MLADLRLAVRQLHQSPGFTALAVLSLALGIGANAAVFSLVNEFLLRPLPVRAPEELVIFRNVEGPRGGLAQSVEGFGGMDIASGRYYTTSFSLGMIGRFRAHPEVLSEVIAFVPSTESFVLVDGAPEIGLTAQLVSGNYFSGLGVSMQVGRPIASDDDRVSAQPVAVISHRFWQRRFAGSGDVLGRTVTYNNVPVTIIGVAARDFGGTSQVGEHSDIYLPLAQHGRFEPDSAEERSRLSTWWVRIMGRLAPGVTAAQARATLEPVFVATAQEGWRNAPPSPEGRGEMPGAPTLHADPGFQGERDYRQHYKDSLRLMQGLVGLVLLAACANVANLLLARGAARRREIAVRLALGASRVRIVRQLLAESLVLAAFSALAGLTLAASARGALIALQPFGSQSANLELPLDWRVVAFTVAAALVTTVAFGLAPALRATKLDLTQEFQGGRGARGARSRLSRALMATQLALSLVLLVCLTLLLGSLRNLDRVDAGFNRRSLLLFNFNLTAAGFDEAQTRNFRDRAQERLAALPGVRGVTFSRVPVLSHHRQTSSVLIPGVTPPKGASGLEAHFNAVAPNFFSVLELPLVLGRGFTTADGPSSPKVAIVNETFARLYLAGAYPLGLRFHYPGDDKNEFEIVGVARDAKYADLRSEVPPTVYLSAAQRDGGYIFYTVRYSGSAEALTGSVREAIRTLAPQIPVLNLRTMDQQVDMLHSEERLFAKLAGLFGALSLLLTSVGLYGLMSYLIARRTSEIGVRMALGALPIHILRQFIGEAGAMVATGVAAGGLAAWGVAQLLRQMLYGLTPADPSAYAIAAAGLGLAALVTAAVPAWRASRVSPSEALRAD